MPGKISLQFKFGLSYILVILAVLLLLNTYPLLVSQNLVFRTKQTAMVGSVKIAEAALSGLADLTEDNVAQAMSAVEETGVSRVLVTDTAGRILYDTREGDNARGLYAFYTEIAQALRGNDTFYCRYDGEAFLSRGASTVCWRARACVCCPFALTAAVRCCTSTGPAACDRIWRMPRPCACWRSPGTHVTAPGSAWPVSSAVCGKMTNSPTRSDCSSAILRRMYGASSRTRPAASSVPDCGRSMATRSGPRSCSVSISAAPTGAAPCGGRVPDWRSWPCDIFFNRERNETIMKKTAVVYWSSTGNTEAMAQAVLEGMKEAGAEAVLLTPDAVDVGALAGMDAIAFGCPAMGSEVLEECEFEPMFSGCKNRLGGKSVGLFGSYGWGDGQWMRDWEKDCDDAGIHLVCESVICCETPDDAALEACRAMGKALAE